MLIIMLIKFKDYVHTNIIKWTKSVNITVRTEMFVLWRVNNLWFQKDIISISKVVFFNKPKCYLNMRYSKTRLLPLLMHFLQN